MAASAALPQGKVYLVLGSDTGIWEGMDVARFHCTYALGLFTDPARNAATVMDPAFRSGLTDSYGTPVKLTWWMMAGNIFRYATNTDIPHPNTMTLHLMKQYQGAAIRTWGDELTLHYHTFFWSDYDGDGKWYWNQAKQFTESSDDFDATLGEMLLEEEQFPVSFRSGWHAMDNGWQKRLNTLLPYSLHNDWPAKRAQITEPIDNVFDWSRASSKFVPFHPSEADYQLPGTGAGWNVRSKYMASADSAFMSAIFREAELGKDQVVCLWAHLPETDFLDNVRKVNTSAHKVAPLHPTVTFRYCTAVEAMQRWRGTTDTTQPVLSIEEVPGPGGLLWTIRSNEPIFQPAPFIAYKDRNEIIRVLSSSQTGVNAWQTVTPVPPEDVAKIGAAVADTSGNGTTAVLRYLPDEIFVDDADAGYSEPGGTWAASVPAVWGITSRAAPLVPGATARAQWVITVPSTRLYNLFLQVPSVPSPARRVSVVLREAGNTLDSLYFPEGLPGGGWTYIRTGTLHTSTACTLEIAATGDGQAGSILAADVVKISPLVRDRWLVAPEAFEAGELIVAEPVTRTIGFTNQGIHPVSIISATFTRGTGSTAGSLPVVIPPMGRSGLRVIISAAATGMLADTLIVQTDDPQHALVRIPLHGIVKEYFAEIDDRDSLRYGETGAWNFSNARAYGLTSRFAYPAAGVSAIYRVRLKKRGVYDIAEILPVTSNASLRARYVLTAGGKPIDSVFIDQNQGSGGWVTLMTMPLPADTEVAVNISDAMNPVVSGKVLRADAIRFQWLRDDVTSAGDRKDFTAKATALLQNYPNPFNPETTVEFRLQKTAYVSLRVFDLLGREVAVLVNDIKPAGVYSVRFSAEGLASGVYFYRLQAGTFFDTRRMLLTK
jgi:hypothetical protein